MNPLFIGISGKKRSGKSTLATLLQGIIVKESLHHVTLKHFGTSIKINVAELFNVTTKRVEEEKELFRPLLQWYGYEYLRYINKTPNYSIQQMEYGLKHMSDIISAVIIPDVRFLNEVKYIREKPLNLLIRIESESKDNDSHPSECELDNLDPKTWDYIYHNCNKRSMEKLTTFAEQFYNGRVKPLLPLLC